jgi:hypothetical protein
MPGDTAGTRLVPDLVRVDIGAVAVLEQGGLDRTPRCSSISPRLALVLTAPRSGFCEPLSAIPTEQPERAPAASAVAIRIAATPSMVIAPTRKIVWSHDLTVED